MFDVSDDEGVFTVGWDEFDRRTTVNGGVTFGSGMAADEEDISTALWKTKAGKGMAERRVDQVTQADSSIGSGHRL